MDDENIISLKAENERLKRSQSLMVDAQNVAHLGTWEWSVGQPTVTWSPELYRIYGVTPLEYTPTYAGYMAKIHPADRERVSAIMSRALKEQLSFSHDERILRPDGSVRALHTWGHSVIGEDGKFIRMIGVCQDITELQQSKSYLEQSLSLQRATLESTADGLMVVDAAGKIVGFNRRLLEVWKIPAALISGQNYKTALNSVLNLLVDPEICVRRLDEIFAEPDQESYDVIRFKNGTVLERYSRPQRLNGVTIGRVFSYRNVTDRVQALDSLHKSETQIRLQTSRLKVLADASKTFAEARLELAPILEYSAKIIAEHFQEGCIIRLFSNDRSRLDVVAFHHVDPEVKKKIEHDFLIYTTKSLSIPLRISGQSIGTMTVVYYQENHHSSSEDQDFLQDFANRTSVAIDNARLYEGSKAAIRQRDEFIMTASHELRTPLTPLKLQLQLLLKHVRSGIIVADPKTLDLFKLLEASNTHLSQMIRLIEEMLDVTRVNTGRGLSFSEVNLATLIKEVVGRYQPELESAKCAVEVCVQSQAVGYWDRFKLERAVTNLLTNAIKFGAARPIKITVSGEGDFAKLTVTDLGIGIAKKDQSRIFDRFGRAESVMKYRGIGLGLFLTRQIVEAHGGKISVESSPGKGATFIITLPCKVAKLAA